MLSQLVLGRCSSSWRTLFDVFTCCGFPMLFRLSHSSSDDVKGSVPFSRSYLVCLDFVILDRTLSLSSLFNMHFTACLSFLLTASLCAAATRNPKRGLVFVNSPDAGVNSIWLQDGSPLTWYYNYEWNETAVYASHSQQDFEFVPMYWVSVSRWSQTHGPGAPHRTPCLMPLSLTCCPGCRRRQRHLLPGQHHRPHQAGPQYHACPRLQPARPDVERWRFEPILQRRRTALGQQLHAPPGYGHQDRPPGS